MATINYNGMELEEFTSDKPVVFDKHVRALCWNNNGWHGGTREYVIAFIPRSDSSLVVTDHSTWLHMALLPEGLAPRKATYRELAKWLAQGNGEMTCDEGNTIYTTLTYTENRSVAITAARVRKWDDTEWHEPDVSYMEIVQENT